MRAVFNLVSPLCYPCVLMGNPMNAQKKCEKKIFLERFFSFFLSEPGASPLVSRGLACAHCPLNFPHFLQFAASRVAPYRIPKAILFNLVHSFTGGLVGVFFSFNPFPRDCPANDATLPQLLPESSASDTFSSTGALHN